MSSTDTSHSHHHHTRPQGGRGREHGQEQGRGQEQGPSQARGQGQIQGRGRGIEQRVGPPTARSSVFREPLRDFVVNPIDYVDEPEMFAGFLRVFHEEFVDSNFFTIEVGLRTTNVVLRGMRALTHQPMPPDVRQFISFILRPLAGASGPLFPVLHPSTPPMVEALKYNETRHFDDGQLFAGFLRAMDDELMRVNFYSRMERHSAEVLKRGLATVRQVPLNVDVQVLLNDLTSTQRQTLPAVPRVVDRLHLPIPAYNPLQEAPAGFSQPSPAIRSRLRAREEALVYQTQQRARRRP